MTDQVLNAKLLKENRLLKRKISALEAAEARRRDAETQFRSEHDFLAAVLETIDSLIVVLDPGGKIVLFNKQCEITTGYSFKEVQNQYLWEYFLIPEELRPVKKLFRRMRAGDFPTKHENYWLTKKGNRRLIAWSNTSILDERGKVKYIIGTGIDITDRRKVELALRSSEEKYRGLHERMLDGFVSTDLKGAILETNNNYLNMLGYDSGEIRRLRYQDITPRKWHEFESRIVEKEILKRGYSGVYEKEYMKKDGSTLPVELQVYLVKNDGGKPVGMRAFVRDITERKEAERELKNSEARLRQVIDLVPHFIFAKNRKGEFILVNKAVADAYGTTVENLVGKTDADFNQSRAEVTHFLNDDKDVMDSGLSKDIPEEKITDAGGGIRYLHTIKIPFTVSHPPEDAVLGVSTDITERKKAQEALIESEERFRSLVQKSSDMITIHDDRFLITFVTPSLQQITGYRIEDLIGIDPLTLVHPGDIDRVRKEVSKVFQLKNEGVPTEYRFRHANGSWIWLETVANNQLENPYIRGIILTSRDITEHKNAKAQLEELNERLRALTANMQQVREEESARIAREIHDELGQTLTGIKMDLSFLGEDLSEEGSLTRSADLIKKVNSVASLVDNAIKTMRKITTELRPAILDSMGLSAAIEWQAEEFQNRTGIICEFQSLPLDPNIGQSQSTAIFRILQESLTNILRHAKAKKVVIRLKTEGSGISLEIEDDGTGIEPSDVKKVKSFGILGMRERVSLLGGSFDIEGIKERGTTVRIRIPIPGKSRTDGF